MFRRYRFDVSETSADWEIFTWNDSVTFVVNTFCHEEIEMNFTREYDRPPFVEPLSVDHNGILGIVTSISLTGFTFRVCREKNRSPEPENVTAIFRAYREYKMSHVYLDLIICIQCHIYT